MSLGSRRTNAASWRPRRRSAPRKRSALARRPKRKGEPRRRARSEGMRKRRRSVGRPRNAARREPAPYHGGAASDQPAQNMAGASSGKNWRVVAAVAGLALFGAAMALLAERGNRPVNTPIVESNPLATPPGNAVASAPAAPPAPASTGKIQAGTPSEQTASAQKRALKAGDLFKECGERRSNPSTLPPSTCRKSFLRAQFGERKPRLRPLHLVVALHWLAGVLILELIAHGWIMVQASARLGWASPVSTPPRQRSRSLRRSARPGDARRQRERCSPAGPLPPPLRRKRPRSRPLIGRRPRRGRRSDENRFAARPLFR